MIIYLNFCLEGLFLLIMVLQMFAKESLNQLQLNT